MIYGTLKAFAASQLGTPLDIFAAWCLMFAILGGLRYTYGNFERPRIRPWHGFTTTDLRRLSFSGLAAVSLWLAEAVVLLS